MIFETVSSLNFSTRTACAVLIFAATASAAPTRSASDSDSSVAVSASNRLETDNFLVEIGPTGPYKAGETGSVRVALTTKGIFHINGQYPYRFKTAAPADGVSYPKPILERADGQFAEKTAVFTVPFVATHAGTFKIAGVFHMSVCSPASCLVQKAPLETSVTIQ